MTENKEEIVVNLEKVRDEKCFPIARAIFKEFPTGLIPDAGKNNKALQLSALSVMLDADLNIAEEVSYVNQLLLGVLSGLNKTVQNTGNENADDIYYGIARNILKIVADHIDTVSLDKVTPEVTEKDFADIRIKLVELFEEHNLSQLEVKYITDKIFTEFTNFHNALSASITSSTERMECKILGIEFMSDLNMKKLNDVLLTE